MKKILIIEDNWDDYVQVINILAHYEVAYYPLEEDFRRFSSLIVKNAKRSSPQLLEKIKSEAAAFTPDFIFLDLGLDGRRDTADASGLVLRKAIFDEDFAAVPVLIMSGKSGENIDDDDYLYKRAPGSFAGEILRKFITRFSISQSEEGTRTAEEAGPIAIGAAVPDQPPAAPNDNHLGGAAPQNPAPVNKLIPGSKPVARNQPKEADMLRSAATEPLKLTLFKLKNEHIWGPRFQTFIDTVVIYLFYILLLSMGIIGPVMIWVEGFKQFDLLHLAEVGFIAFLPLLVVFGFFAFYKRSLRPLLTGATLDNVDYERASELMMLTKKLFISSLISYLFTKLIELLFLTHLEETEKKEWKQSFFQEFYHTGTKPFLQLALIGSAIVALILFYIYLSSHKPHRNENG